MLEQLSLHRTRRLFIEQDTEQNLDPSLIESHESRRESLESHMMMTGGFDQDLDLQASMEDSSGVDLSLEEEIDMTKVVMSREKRPPMSVKSSNSEIQISIRQRTMFISLELSTRV